MPLPRYKQINTDVTPYYHCISRCVRQSYLCGRDARTGINYEHRRKWIQDRLHKLSQAFAIDLCAYAVMHNHIHVVLHIAKGRAEGWTMDEVLFRWRMFYKCPPVVQRYLENFDSVTLDELAELKSLSVIYRERLQSISSRGSWWSLYYAGRMRCDYLKQGALLKWLSTIRWVMMCCGFERISSVSPNSTTSPSCITIILSGMCLMIPMCWDT